MKRKYLLAIVLVFLALLTFCQTKNQEPSVEDFLPLPKGKKSAQIKGGTSESCDDPEHFKKIKQAAKLNSEGLQLLKIGDIEKAAQKFRQALEIIPTFADARFNLGLILMRKKEYKQAIKTFAQVIKLVPDWVDAYVNLAVAEMNLGKHKIALKHLKHAISLDDTSPNTWLNLGLLYFAIGEIDKGNAVFAEALKRFPKDKTIGISYVRELLNRRLTKKAKNVLDILKQRHGETADIALLYGRLYIEQGDYSNALKYLLIAEKLGASPQEVHTLKGVVFEEFNRFEDALKEFEKALKYAPESAEIQLHIGATLVELSRFEEAKKILKNLINKTKDTQVWLYLGAALQATGDIKEAINAYNKFLKLTSPYDKYRKEDLKEVKTIMEKLKKGEKAPLPGVSRN